MSVSDMIRLGTGKLTAQQLADMALEQDRERRRMRARGDTVREVEAWAEAAKLAALSIEAGRP